MSTLSIASSEADAAAVTAVEQHHAQLAGALASHVERLVTAASGGDTSTVEAARLALVGWCRHELVPHAAAEEEAMYPAAHALAEGRLLVTSMVDEHQVITGLVDAVERAPDPVRAAAAATALRVLFVSHVAKENELVLPLLAGSREVSVAGLLDGMHELLGGHGHGDHEEHAPPAGDSTDQSGGHTCACGGADDDEVPELDARLVPHAIRHATIFGALDALTVGQCLVLVADHAPLPLLAQLQQRWPGVFDVDEVESGPDTWRLRFTRVG